MLLDHKESHETREYSSVTASKPQITHLAAGCIYRQPAHAVLYWHTVAIISCSITKILLYMEIFTALRKLGKIYKINSPTEVLKIKFLYILQLIKQICCKNETATIE
jgi:hypothetical protein